jgi:hypothetical protein
MREAGAVREAKKICKAVSVVIDERVGQREWYRDMKEF